MISLEDQVVYILMKSAGWRKEEPSRYNLAPSIYFMDVVTTPRKYSKCRNILLTVRRCRLRSKIGCETEKISTKPFFVTICLHCFIQALLKLIQDH